MINSRHFVLKPHAGAIKPKPGFCGSGFGLLSAPLDKGNAGSGNEIGNAEDLGGFPQNGGRQLMRSKMNSLIYSNLLTSN